MPDEQPEGFQAGRMGERREGSQSGVGLHPTGITDAIRFVNIYRKFPI
jgi:hypothetical protein